LHPIKENEMKTIPVPNFLDDNGESEDDCIAVETSLKELAQKQTSTCCGCRGNRAFQAVFNEMGDRQVVGWHDPTTNKMYGMDGLY